jgi:single-strand DNA-binding protein
MNSCILMAEIIQDPELRYTSDTQTPIAEMVVQFPGLRAEDPPATLKVTGWGNLAQEIQEGYHQGDRVVIEGRLGMNTIERPEGFKEKRAEMTVQRIHRLGANTPLEASPLPPTASSTASTAAAPAAAVQSPPPAARTASPAPAAKPAARAAAPAPEPEFDDIPF